MNKLKEYFWVWPNEWFDKKNCDFLWGFIFPLAPSLLTNEYFEGYAFRVFITWMLCFALYRFIWNQFNPTEEPDFDDESDYDFNPIFLKSATREHLLSALESAKTSRQLAAAQENDEEFECWETVILDIEGLIENYSE